MSFKVLESVLRPLSYWYTQDNIEEVAINRSKQIWLRLRGKRAYPWVMYKDEKLTKEYLTDLLYIIANTYELPFDPVSGTPVVYAAIPGEHRFSAIAGRNVMYDDEDLTGGIALTIRVHSEDVAWGLKDYGLAQGEKLHKINPLKDVDCFHPYNMGRIATGTKPYVYPCTPKGIIRLLEYYNIQPQGKHAVVIGRSNIVGRPVAQMLLNENATVTICHSKTANLAEITKTADILISAVGQKNLVKPDMVKEGVVVIDVGMNRTDEGKLCGDVDFYGVEPKASFITPVPGGVGPMTICSLMQNTFDLYNIQYNS